MKTLKTLIMPVLLLLTVVSCTDEGTKNYEPKRIEPILVAKGDNMNIGYANQNIVIGEKKDWDELLSKLQEWHLSAEFVETNIDFNTFQVIAAFDEFHGSLYKIEIANITEYESNIVVKVKRSSTAFIGAVTSQPYHIVKIPKSIKPIVFEQFEPKALESSLIGRGNMTGKEGIGWPYQTITNETKWVEVMNELNKIENVTDKFVDKNIDFSKHIAIALLFDSGYNPCTEKDYVMEIESVIEKEDEVIVKCKIVLQSNDVVPSRLPFIVFKIPKTDKPILCIRITT